MIPIARPWLPPLEEYTALLAELWETRMLSNFGEFSQRLEQLVAGHLGVEHVLSTSSGDTGLILTLAALELPEGSPCFVSDFTFNSTINAALWNRLHPVLVDIDADSLNLSPQQLMKAMEDHPRPGVVLGTHVFGNPCDVAGLESAAAQHGSYLVFDAAHAYGSMREGLPVGTFGDAEVFSLSGTKLVTSGEGGLVTTRHAWLAERLGYLRGYGFQIDYISKRVGLNGKLSEFHAGLGLLTLPHIERVVERRNEIAARYLTSLPGSVGSQAVRPDDRSAYKDILLRLGDRRSEVERDLMEHGVQVKRYFVPLHTMDLYADYGTGDYDSTDRVYSEGLCVPTFAEIGDETVDGICDQIRKALQAD